MSLPPHINRGISQAAVLLMLLETKDTAKLAGFWPRVPEAERPMLSACIREVATAASAALPAELRVAAADRQAELLEATRAATNAMQQAACIYGQARHVIEVMTSVVPDKHDRLLRYRRKF